MCVKMLLCVFAVVVVCFCAFCDDILSMTFYFWGWGGGGWGWGTFPQVKITVGDSGLCRFVRCRHVWRWFDL